MVRHVLVPVDASEAAQRALVFALEEYADDDITVLHVTNPVEDASLGDEDALFTGTETLEWEGTDAEDIFADARQIANERGATVEAEVTFGSPASAIVEYAEDRGVDHIVIGSHGRSGVARLLLGSVAENVARRAPVPITIVK